MSLPYLEAFSAKESGAISWEEYIHCLFARWRGIKHEQDNVEGMYWDLRTIDPFGYFIWCLSDHLERMKDTSEFEGVFIDYRRGTLDDVRNRFTSLRGPPANGVLKSLAFLALQERRPEVLEFCFDQDDWAFEPAFMVEVETVDQKKDPETFKVVEQSRYRKLCPRKDRKDGESNSPAATFDLGGKLPVEW